MATRNLIQAIIASLLVFFLAQFLLGRFGLTPTGPGRSEPADPTTSAPSSAPADAARFTTAPAPAGALVTLNNGALEVVLAPRAAAVDTVRLVSRDARGRLVYRAEVDSDEPYVLLAPLAAGDRTVRSFQTHLLAFQDGEHEHSVPLDHANWSIAAQDARSVAFETTVQDDTGEPVATVRKTYTLDESKPLCRLSLAIRNPRDEAASVRLEQDGGLGIPRENVQFNMRWVAAGLRAEPGQELEVTAFDSSRLAKPGEHPLMRATGGENLVWTAITNKYFAAYLRPISVDGQPADRLVRKATAFRAAGAADADGDLGARLHIPYRALPAGGALAFDFEIYAGPKDRDIVGRIDPTFANPNDVGYSALFYADRRCFCEFEWLTQFMTTFLELIHRILPNYGLAIIALVIVVRTLLHPLSVFQQKSMFRAQEAMSRIQPKIVAAKAKFPDDKVKQNQEQMRIYAEEGVNPAAPLVGIVPMFIQMPILIALWRGINRDIHLRHAPFDGWWIVDLGSPDALYAFAGNGITIPVLGWLLPWMFANIPTFNLLPLLMGVSMWLQQKYMPKPHLKAKLEAARKAREEGREPDKGPGGMTVEDQIRQQQIMAYMMSIMFPLMFYYMPAGLNLYWLATNVFGIGESILIRRQLDEEQRRREAGEAPVAAKKKGMMARWLEKMAESAEELQKIADTASQTGAGNKGPRMPKVSKGGQKKRKSTRF